jgi:RNA polymerase sigma-70 factor, ECF subfamily
VNDGRKERDGIGSLNPSMGSSERVDPLPKRFSSAYEAHFSDVYRFLRRLGVREGDIEDVCHEVFIVFHRKMGEVLPDVSDRSFLLGIGSRVAADYRRLKRHTVTTMEDASIVAASAHPEALYAMRGDLERSLDRLAEERRTVLVMHELEGMSAPEMASVLGIPLNTVYSRIRLARADFDRAVHEAKKGGGTHA